MDSATGREVAVDSFKKYCSACKGKCCFNGELNLFKWERERLALETTVYDRCHFCGERGCTLEIARKPLDCISYPVYPEVKPREDGGSELAGLIIHKSCPYSNEIAGDDALIRVMRAFWEAELEAMSAEDMHGWYLDENGYWSDENVVRAGLR